ncbi:FAD-binding oxidoreductase [Streptomyces cyaneofuscatus]|uniref:FAD-binding oxidoreductase n=1 Tax=Streptomyces cyaneofuscatus TaxID=66883 RepID=UPI003659CB69
MIIPPDKAAELERSLDGEVLRPGQPAFDDARRGFQLGTPHEPALIAVPASSGDLARVVAWAADLGLGVAMQCTGHGTCAPADDDSVLISTVRLTGVRVDPHRRTAQVEAGALWRDVVNASAQWNLVPPCGASLGVGVVGYLLGGGLGLLGRTLGSPADFLTSMTVVTSRGELVHADPHQNAELFWGMKGSKGNLGVVASMTMDLVSLPEFFGGGLFFEGSNTLDVLHAYTRWVSTPPDSLCTSVAMLRYPGIEQVPPFLRGRQICHVRIVFTGGEAEARSLMSPLLGAAPVLKDTTAVLPFTACESIHADPVDPVTTVSGSMLLRDLDADALHVLEAEAVGDHSVPLFVELRHMQGKLARGGAPPAPVGPYPEAVFNLFVVAHLEPDAGEQAKRAAGTRVQDLLTALRPWAAPGVLPNFLVGPQDEDTVRAAYGDSAYRRLRRLKQEYDPMNMFRYNLNITPASD